MSRHHTSVADAALDLANSAREANAIETAIKCGGRGSALHHMLASREEEVAAEFETLAKLLGFTVSKIEPALIAAE